MKLYHKLLIGVLLLVGTKSEAQQLPMMNHYIYNPYLYNPARTGQSDKGLIALHFKKQWTSMPNSPFTGAFSVESPVKSEKLGNMGLGGMLYVDQTHIVSNVGGLASYAYHIPFVKNKPFKHGLSAGMSLGFIHQRINYPDAVVENPDDNQLLPSQGAGTSFDFSAGLDYQYKGLHIGVSMIQGLNTGLKLLDQGQNDLKYINTRQWLVAASYKHLFGPTEKNHRLYLQPVFMGRIVENIPFQAEANVIVGLDKMGWLALGYRSSNNVTATSSLDATLGIEIKDNLIFAYTFGIGVDANLNANMGTQHEFMLGYRIGENSKLKKIQESMETISAQNKDLQLKVDENAASNKEQFDSLTTIIKKNHKITTQIIKEQADAINDHSMQIQQQQTAIDKNKAAIAELKKKLENQPLKFKKVGEVFFDNGSIKLNDASNANLDAVNQAIEAAKATGSIIKVYIKGNASTNGDAKRNMELSLRRATAVRQYLVSKGMDGNNVTVIPMGEEDPTDGQNASSKGDSKDRRVDIIFTEKKAKGRL
jgi:type IX secretion system PorP/SprF family membrane protein